MKIIGILTAWGNENWIEIAIKQGLELCDELNVCVSAHSDRMLKYEDETYNIAKKYESEIRLFDYKDRSFHAEIKADILNMCMLKSKYFAKGNWVWVLDVDEFYNKESISFIKKAIDTDIWGKIQIKSRFFYINTQNYLISEHERLFKIQDTRNRFLPTQQWPYADKIGLVPLEFGMHHYAMLQNLHMKREFWQSEYYGSPQDNKTAWLDKIYRNYELDNEVKWLFENKRLSGNYGPWISNAFMPDIDGRLFKYTEKHPKLVEESGLTEIEDYREYWKF